jgi:protein-L-isoaspartate(D-aspartate) O-methyltransferase
MDDPFAALLAQMLAEIVAETAMTAEVTGVTEISTRVLHAIARVPRHEFVPVELRPAAYANTPLPVGCGKTISQPYIVALMTELLDVGSQDRVLEIGSGFGYQASILSHLAREVYTVELIEELARGAQRRFSALKIPGVQIKIGNGYYGWPEHAPFDRIMVTAAPDLIPPPLLAQLKPGGRMMIPTGIPDDQQLVLVEKSAGGQISTRNVLPVRFSALDEPGDMVGMS